MVKLSEDKRVVKKMKAVLFDLDGTLLPMDEEVFTKAYFKLLCKKLCPLGIEPQALVDAIWTGTKAMVLNDGTDTNNKVFWDEFTRVTGLDWEPFDKLTVDFYVNEFHGAKAAVGENPLAKEVLKLVRDKGMKVIIATNPIFPKAGQLSRLEWLGIDESEFDAITPYEEFSYAKPNPKYYETILKEHNLRAEDCLMVGNDEREDMYAAGSVGMDTFLITDCVKRSEKYPYSGRQGDFKDLINYINTL